MSPSEFDVCCNEMYLLYKGVRNCALLENHYEKSLDIRKDFRQIKSFANQYNLKIVMYVKSKLKQYRCYVYRYNYQRILIDFVEHDFNSPQSQFISEYIIGKLLGYSDKSMSECLTLLFSNKIPIPSKEIIHAKIS